MAALLDERRSHRRARAAAVDALHDGAGIDGLFDAVVAAVSVRMLRYDVAGEVDFHDDFGWLDITHGLTYANAARWHADGPRAIPTWCGWRCRTVFQAHWTGRHEWHAGVGEAEAVDTGADESRRARRRRGAAATGLLDDTSALIVHAHAVKTTTAATAEAVRAGNDAALQAATRFLDAPKLERFVAANVMRSIDFLSGPDRPRRTESRRRTLAPVSAITPGFVCAHHHLYSALARGMPAPPAHPPTSHRSSSRCGGASTPPSTST